MKTYHPVNVLSEGINDIILKYNNKLFKLDKNDVLNWDIKEPLKNIKTITVNEQGIKTMERRLTRLGLTKLTIV